MTIAAIAWHRPASLAEACALGLRYGSDAAFLAGGTELIPDYQRARETASHLIALESVPELRGITQDQGLLRIGALTTIAEIAASPVVRAIVPALADAARAIGSPQIRSMATIGGNFCRAVPCADTPPAAIVSAARVRLVGTAGARELDAVDFFTGARVTALAAGEVLVEIVIPVQPPHSGASYQRFARRRGPALAVAAVAARVTLDRDKISEVRIALGAVSPTPLTVARASALLEGETPSSALFEAAGELCAQAALPISDVRGSADYRRELVRVLARRALQEALARAGGSVQ
ncbi:MAG: FAD binding domain-containing protein [Gemmatimonadaceae bacterium]